VLFQAAVLDALCFLADAFVHLLVLPPDLFARTGRKMGGDDAEVGAIELRKLNDVEVTSKSLNSSSGVQGPV